MTARKLRRLPAGVVASSHREAPRPGYVTFIANVQPFSEPDGGPNFYPFATDAFPYVALPNVGAVNAGVGTGAPAAGASPAAGAPVVDASPAAGAASPGSRDSRELTTVAAVTTGGGVVAVLAALVFFLRYRRRRPGPR